MAKNPSTPPKTRRRSTAVPAARPGDSPPFTEHSAELLRASAASEPEVVDDAPEVDHPDGHDADLDLDDLAEVASNLPLDAAEGDELVDEPADERAGERRPARRHLVSGAAAAEGKRSYSLVRSDPLTAYMQEIRRYPLLSREDEHTLAVEFAKSQDPKLARQLITANLRLVVKIAHEYRRAYRNLLDLVQEGNLGLLQAVQKYDPHRGVKLSSYAAWWIRAYMLKFILNNWRLVKIGTTQAQRKLFFNLSKEREKLENAGIAPTSLLLAEKLSVPEQEVTDMQMRLSASETSLDAPVGRDDEGGRSQIDMLESPGASRPDVTAESEEFRALLRQKLETFYQTLVGREQTLFHDRLMADQPLTLQDVGERYGISRERARQIEARLLSRLKTYLKKELGDAVQVAMGLD